MKETGKWVVICYIHYEPTGVYGFFTDEVEAHKFADDNPALWEVYDISMVLTKGD